MSGVLWTAKMMNASIGKRCCHQKNYIIILTLLQEERGSDIENGKTEKKKKT